MNLATSNQQGDILTTLLHQTLIDQVDKTCQVCSVLTSHLKTTHFNDMPRFLIIILNRFKKSNTGYRKNGNKVGIEKCINIDGIAFELVGVIHHLGNSTSSGHYTSEIKTDRFYHCNDSIIKEISVSELQWSASAYMVIYKNSSIV